MKDDDFFNNLAIEYGITDIKTAKQFYYALIRVLYKHLKNSGKITMPDWGTYKIKPQVSKRIYDINTGGTRVIPETNTLRFKVDRKLKNKIKHL